MGYDVKVNDPVQGRGAGARLLGPAGAPPQPADRGEPPALHGRAHAREVRRIRARSSATSTRCSRRSRSTPPSAARMLCRDHGHDHHHHGHDHDAMTTATITIMTTTITTITTTTTSTEPHHDPCPSSCKLPTSSPTGAPTPARDFVHTLRQRQARPACAGERAHARQRDLRRHRASTGCCAMACARRAAR